MRYTLALSAMLAAQFLSAQTLLGGMPQASGSVYALEKVGNTMYMGGFFTQVNGQPRAGLARFNAATGVLDGWAPTGITNGVTSITSVAGKIVVGGSFTTVNGQSRMGICMFDHLTGNLDPWSANANFLSWRQGVGVQGDTFYHSTFSPARVVGVNAATGANTGWQSSPLFQEQGNINAILVTDDHVYVGGIFSFASGSSAYDNLCRFHLATGELDSTWAPQPAINNFGITAIVRTNNLIFVGGDYATIAGQARQGVAAFTENGTLAPFAQASSSYEVLSLFPDGDKIWVGGNSSTLGGQPRFRIAQIAIANATATCWNASSTSNAWSTVQAIHVAGDTVHAGPFGTPSLAVFTGGPLPVTPTAITGPASAAPGQSTTYSVPNVPGLTYSWTVTGGTGSSTTNSIDITWGSGPAGTVQVVVTNPAQTNCSSNPAVLSVTISGTTAMAEAGYDTRGWSLFPNPTTGHVTLRRDHDAAAGTAEVRVMDVLGNIVMRSFMKGPTHEMDLGALPGGAYIVVLSGQHGAWASRLIKHE